jgi:hypothetical protein
MLNDVLGLRTANLSRTTEEICRIVYGEFLRTFDLQGKWRLLIKAVDTDRIFIQSCPTGNQHGHPPGDARSETSIGCRSKTSSSYQL